jgi:CheY-like chemotaxis protein
MRSMLRPCFLVIDREFPGSISTRKLVIETAKFNVLTAYSGREALQIFKLFPAVNGIVLDGGLEDVDCNDLTREMKLLRPTVPIVVIVPPGMSECPDADFHLESFAIEKRNEDLSLEKH